MRRQKRIAAAIVALTGTLVMTPAVNAETISCPPNLSGTYVVDTGNTERRYFPESYMGPRPEVYTVWDLSKASSPDIALTVYCHSTDAGDEGMDIPRHFKECHYRAPTRDRAAYAGTFECSTNPPDTPSREIDTVNPGNDEAVAAFARIISLLDQGKFPLQYGKDFSENMRPYLTQGLIKAIHHGSGIAEKKGYNLWDGDIITGAQNQERVTLWATKIVKRTADTAIIDVASSTSDTLVAPDRYMELSSRYWLKKENGIWKIDDSRYIGDRYKSDPTMKALFQDPDKYFGPH